MTMVTRVVMKRRWEEHCHGRVMMLAMGLVMIIALGVVTLTGMVEMLIICMAVGCSLMSKAINMTMHVTCH